MSFKPQVQVTGEGDKWHSNGLAFATRKEAEDNARDLYGRWMLATAHRAVESDEPVNYKWVDGRLEPVAQETAAAA
jgi:hypothetical protein